MNADLAALNFARLLHYKDGPPLPRPRYETPLVCTGFCESCEKQALLADSNKKLYLMSHGACTSDFVTCIGAPLPLDGKEAEELKVMFLLESPGGDRPKNPLGDDTPGQYGKKRPPNRIYYWMPDHPVWPSRDETDFSNRFGDYFARLLRRFRLKHAYFTNVIKCGLRKVGSSKPFPYSHGPALYRKIRNNCYVEFLRKEMQIFKPDVIFAFGDAAYDLFNTSPLKGEMRANHLWHPKRRRVSFPDLIKNNDIEIERALCETHRARE